MVGGPRSARAVAGLVIAAPASGAGKTTVALALTAAATRRGLTVQPFKVGPDFIDPAHHAAIAGRAARTLDGWMLGRAASIESFAAAMRDADLAIVEGMMGLFDGLAPTSEVGSTAEMAKWLGLPVLLVIDAGAMARSAAALAVGFRDFDPAVRVAGVVFNRVGGATHLGMLRDALVSSDGPACLGGLPLAAALAIPERHLGLVTAAETVLPAGALAESAERHLEVDAILTLAGALSRMRTGGTTRTRTGHAARTRPGRAARMYTGRAIESRRVVARRLTSRRAGAKREADVAIARDPAFSFYYPENLERLAEAGACLVEFSPLSDSSLPPRASAVYLGGGYPELHAAALAANVDLLADLRRFAQAGGLIYAECGGLMLLGRSLVDIAGARYPMAGVFGFSTRMLARGLTLGYREVTIGACAPLGRAPSGPRARRPVRGLCARGHEFHHSVLEESSIPAALGRCYSVRDPWTGAVTREGFTCGRTLASYVHLHFASAPELAPALVAAARAAAVDLARASNPTAAARRTRR